MPKKASRRKRDGVPGHCSSLAAGRAKAKADAEKTSQDPVSSDSDESLEDELNNLDSSLVSQEGDCGVDEEQPATKAEGSGTKPKRMKKKLKRLKVNLTMCKYKVIRDVVEWLGWSLTEHETDWNIWWTDMSVGEERCMRLRRPQKLNHFPGMTEVAHKCKLARNLNRMRNVLPELYDFHPETFNLPVDYLAFEHAALGDMEQRKGKGGKSNKSYIIKPDDGACGVGIFITRKPSSVPSKLACVAQRYLNKPLLIDERKFDLRLYVLITSMTPLRVYLFPEGLARFATERYEPVCSANIDKRYMHLTNYSVNRNHKNFETDDSADAVTGSKRSLAFVRGWLSEHGFNVKQVWIEIEKLIVKTLLAIQPSVSHTYRTCISSNNDCVGFSCFDLLGFDIMLDHKAKPWIIEVNEMPSFETAAAIDLSTKSAVLYETLRLVCPTVQEVRLLTEMTKAVKRAREQRAQQRLRAANKSPTSSDASASSSSRKPPEPPEPEVSAEMQIRAELADLRLRQESYERTRFRLIYPLSCPVADGRCIDSKRAEMQKAMAAREVLPKRYAEEPECIELGLSDELWAFAVAPEAEARVRDAALGEEYKQCLAASQEVFENALWLRLGKVPSKQQMMQMDGTRQAQQRSSSVSSSMVQAGQGALLTKTRQQQEAVPIQHLLPRGNIHGQQLPAGEGPRSGVRAPEMDGEEGTSCPLSSGQRSPGEPDKREERERREGASARGAHGPCHSWSYEFVMGGGGAMRAVVAAPGSSPEKHSPLSVTDDMLHSPSVQSGSSADARYAESACEGQREQAGPGPQGVRVQGGSGVTSPNNTSVLHRLAVLRKELDEKRASDRTGIIGIVGTTHVAAPPPRGGGGGAGSSRGMDKVRKGVSDSRSVECSSVLLSKPNGYGVGQDSLSCAAGTGERASLQRHAGVVARGGAAGGQARENGHSVIPMCDAGWLGLGVRGGEGPSSSRSAAVRTAPPIRDGDRDQGAERDHDGERAERVREILRLRSGCNDGGAGVGARMTMSRGGTANTLETARREVKGMQASLFGSRVGSGETKGLKMTEGKAGNFSTGLFHALEANGMREKGVTLRRDSPRITVKSNTPLYLTGGMHIAATSTQFLQARGLRGREA